MFTWFDLAWPWIGLGLGAILAVLLFATPVLRGERNLPRLHDLRWLSFLAVLVYMIHNVEEYGIAANGAAHAFPDSLCQLLGQAPYPGCGVPTVFYLVVNLPLVWLAGPIAALLSRRFPLAGLTLWGVVGVNVFAHVVPAIVRREYDPGLVTAVVLFLPLVVLVFRAVLRSYRRAAVPVLMAAGAFVHIVLGGGVLLFLGGLIPEWVLLVAQPTAIAAGFVAVGAVERRLAR